MKRNVQSNTTLTNDVMKRATVIDNIPAFGEMNVLYTGAVTKSMPIACNYSGFNTRN